MRLNDWIADMERIAPPELALAWDNVGLLVSPETERIERVLVALDCTAEVADEAADCGAQLVLTHHPVLFSGAKRILRDAPDTAAVYRLIRRGVGLYAAHTNLDAAPGGVNDALAARLGLTDVRPLPPEGLGRVGTLPEALPLAAFAALAERALGCTALVSGGADAMVRTVALVGGAGGSDIAAAAQAGADAFVTGECRHHQALEARVRGVALLACGHYATERVVLEALIARLQAVENDVQYQVAQAESDPLRRMQEG